MSGNRQDDSHHPMHQLGDKALSNYLRNGSTEQQQEALAEIYSRHSPEIFNRILKRVDGNQDDAQDVHGQVWLDIWIKHSAFVWYEDAKSDNPLLSWIDAFARRRINKCLQIRGINRAMIHEQSIEEIEIGYIEARLNGKDASKIESEMPGIRERANHRLTQAIKSLNPTDQTIIILRYYKNLSWTEVGEQLGKSSGAVRTAHSRLMKKLRESLDI